MTRGLTIVLIVVVAGCANDRSSAATSSLVTGSTSATSAAPDAALAASSSASSSESISPPAVASESAAPAPVASNTPNTPASGPPALDRVAALLAATPYVEQRCATVDFVGWPFPAKACSYTQKKETYRVVVADPAPARVAAWIDDAAGEIPRLAALRTSSPDHYERGLFEIAKFVSGQSSRIFPLEGDIWEDMAGDGIGKSYPFDRGVSVRSGRCRLTSINAIDWCAYASSRAGATETRVACEERLADVSAFAGVCLDIHQRAWNASTNDGFRAMTRLANAKLDALLSGAGDVEPSRVVEALGRSLGAHANRARRR